MYQMSSCIGHTTAERIVKSAQIVYDSGKKIDLGSSLLGRKEERKRTGQKMRSEWWGNL